MNPIDQIHEILWPAAEPDRSWSPDTLDEIADVVRVTKSSLRANASSLSSRYARMVIGECLSDEQLKAFTDIYKTDVEPLLGNERGFASAELMLEEGGYMVVSLTTWATREDCLRYHSSRNYRQFVAKTQHLLAGQFVVKLFTIQEAGVTR